MITPYEIKQIAPRCSDERIRKLVDPLNIALAEYDITNERRLIMFMAQAAHESGEFQYMEEIASGRAYEGREDLGNTHKGDGVRFKGRGIFQLTGRYNYMRASDEFDVDFVMNPDLVATPKYATATACWYWARNGLNEIADRFDQKAFRTITRRINGGYRGMESRLYYLERAKDAIMRQEK